MNTQHILSRPFKARSFIFGAIALIALFFHLYRLGVAELQGDEASGLLIAIKTSLGFYVPKMFGNIFLFGHTPLRVLVDLPGLALGQYSEFVFRLPNALMGALAVWPLYLVTLKLSRDEKTALFAAMVYSTCGICFGNRLAMGVGPYVFGHTFAIYHLMAFLETEDRKSFLWFGLSCLIAIYSYFEGIMFFIPFVFLLLWQRMNPLKVIRDNYQSILLCLIPIVGFVALWFMVPFYLFKKGLVPDYHPLGGWRILARATEANANNISQNARMILSYTGWPGLIALTPGILLYFFHFAKEFLAKREVAPLAFMAWSMTPIVYFLFFVSDPTNHMAFYFGNILVMAALGYHGLKLPKLQLALGLFIAFCFGMQSMDIVRGLAPIEWGPGPRMGLRTLGIFLREKTAVDEELYLDNVDGHASRFYFGRGYTEDPAEAKYFVVRVSPSMFVPSGAVRLATTDCPVPVAVFFKGESSGPEIKLPCDDGEGRFQSFYSLEKIIPSFWKQYKLAH